MKNTEKRQVYGCLTGYTSSIFEDLESSLRTEVDLDQDDIKLVLDE